MWDEYYIGDFGFFQPQKKLIYDPVALKPSKEHLKKQFFSGQILDLIANNKNGFQTTVRTTLTRKTFLTNVFKCV